MGKCKGVRAPADRDLQERALQGWEWPWEVTAPSPWQARLGWDGSLRNVCLNHAKVIKVYDLIEPPIPLWTRHDHPPQLSALFPDHIWCSVGFIPISMVKPANTSLHFCNVDYKKKSVHSHVSGWILLTSEPTFHRNCDSWISCHHPKSAGRTQAEENPRITKAGKDLQDCQVQPKITGTQPNHAKAIKVLLQCGQPSITWGQEGKSSHKVTVTNLMRGKKNI